MWYNSINLIDICINRQESQKVVNNYFVGTKMFMFELKEQIYMKINQKWLIF